jgi:hypothetical protein
VHSIGTVLARDSIDGAPLYHFKSFDLERFSQVVTDSQIYFSSPADFNDPFEVLPIFDANVGPITASELEALQANVVQRIGETRLGSQGVSGSTRLIRPVTRKRWRAKSWIGEAMRLRKFSDMHTACFVFQPSETQSSCGRTTLRNIAASLLNSRVAGISLAMPLR